jgi:hypothetical protein
MSLAFSHRTDSLYMGSPHVAIMVVASEQLIEVQHAFAFLSAPVGRAKG